MIQIFIYFLITLVIWVWIATQSRPWWDKKDYVMHILLAIIWPLWGILAIKDELFLRK